MLVLFLYSATIGMVLTASHNPECVSNMKTLICYIIIVELALGLRQFVC